MRTDSPTRYQVPPPHSVAVQRPTSFWRLRILSRPHQFRALVQWGNLRFVGLVSLPRQRAPPPKWLWPLGFQGARWRLATWRTWLWNWLQGGILRPRGLALGFGLSHFTNIIYITKNPTVNLSVLKSRKTLVLSPPPPPPAHALLPASWLWAVGWGGVGRDLAPRQALLGPLSQFLLLPPQRLCLAP